MRALMRFAVAAMLAGAAGLKAHGEADAETSGPPNILFLFADDWGWPHAPQYGDDTLDMPAFTRIAEEGVLFEHAFIDAPTCTPARGAILTGQHIWRLGPGANLWSTLPAGHAVYPDLLEDAGYFVGHTRKGWAPGQLNGRDRNPAGPAFDSFASFLDARPEGQPFCFWFGSQDPHRPYDSALRVEKGVDPDAMEPPPYMPDSAAVREDMADYYAEVQRFDRESGELMAMVEDLGELDNTIVVMTGDHGWPFPRGKANLYDAGARIAMAIRWPEGIEAPGRAAAGFVVASDLAPTFLEAAGLEVPGAMTGRSLMPLLRNGGEEAPDRDAAFFGRERHTPAQETGNPGGYPSRAIRTADYLYIHNFESDRWPAGTPDWEDANMGDGWLGDVDNGPAKFYMWANRHDPDVRPLYDLAFGKRPAEELYDVREDRYQMNNLAGDPDYAEVQDELRGRLMEYLEATEDPRATDAPVEFDAYPYFGGIPEWPGQETLAEYER